MQAVVAASCLALLVASAATPSAHAQTTLTLDPRSTYLRTDQDSSVPPLVVSLSAIDVVPGRVIRLAVSGSWQYSGNPLDQSNSTIAVFSSSNVILGPGEERRVPGAIAAGVPFMTASTFHGAFGTDIPEDFSVAALPDSAVTVTVPAGAAFLVICPHDSLYSDNSDPEGDYAVTIGPGCLADFNADETVNSTDVSDFINQWLENQLDGGLITDWDHNGVVNSTDVSEFINSWFDDQAAGCG